MTASPERVRRPLHEVTPGIWVATAERWGTSSTVVVVDAGDCLVVDPALTAAERGALAAEIERRGWRVVAGFSTHPHWDHLLGPASFPGVPHYATPTAAEWAKRHGDELRAEAERDMPGEEWSAIGGVVSLPGDTVPLPRSASRAEVLPLPGHAPGHAGLLLPKHGVLLCGDMLSDVEVPLLDLDHPASFSDYRASLATLAALLTNGAVAVVVPGHGHAASRSEALARVAADQRYLDDLEAGRPSSDLRLSDPWVRTEHDRQVRAVTAVGQLE